MAPPARSRAPQGLRHTAHVCQSARTYFRWTFATVKSKTWEENGMLAKLPREFARADADGGRKGGVGDGWKPSKIVPFQSPLFGRQKRGGTLPVGVCG